MAEAFTKKDRDFIIKIAKECDALKKRVKTLEDEKKLNTHAKAVDASKKQVDDVVAKTAFKVFNAKSAIDVEYGPNPPTLLEQRALATSLYKTLYELCDDNGITSLTVNIKPQQ